MSKDNLFQNWLDVELRDKSLAETLRHINAACGTSYQSNWPAKMEAAGYSLERLPKPVRQYMMRKVLPHLIDLPHSEKQLEKLVKGLT